MSAATDVIYRYDGSFEGLLCCVFESYQQKEIPRAICPAAEGQLTLLQERQIFTDEAQARRVLRSIPEKLGAEALGFIRRAFWTCLAQKELYILLFLRRGYRVGPAVLQQLTDPVVDKLVKAVKHLDNESHLLKGFMRFSDFQHILVAKIGPKNYVLPLLEQHFRERYPEEHFLIHDETHKMALVYQPHRAMIAPLEKLELPAPDAEEAVYRRLWQAFYDAVEIQQRHNPRCRMSFMPQRYWKYMTEFDRQPAAPSAEIKQMPRPAAAAPLGRSLIEKKNGV